MSISGTTITRADCWFGTNATPDDGNIIASTWLDVDGTQANLTIPFPPGREPVGAVDEVVSARSSAAQGVDLYIHYSEE